MRAPDQLPLLRVHKEPPAEYSLCPGDGKIDMSELAELSLHRAAELKLLDTDGDGCIDIDEFRARFGSNESVVQLVADAATDFIMTARSESQCTLGGFTDGWLAQCTKAGAVALNKNGKGVLLSTSGVCGHLQPLAIDKPALLGGAMAGWSATESYTAADQERMEQAVVSALAVYELRSSEPLAQAAISLGRASQVALGLRLTDGSWARKGLSWRHDN